ncbi:unnamed protein product, partial [Prorocentrum cordatum]
MVRPQRYPNVKPLELFPCCHKLIRRATDLFGLAPQPAAALNVILRRYLPGDWLGRHVDDVRMFAEPVFSTVLEVGGPRDGLIFTLPESEHGLELARKDALAAGASSLLEGGALPDAPFQIEEPDPTSERATPSEVLGLPNSRPCAERGYWEGGR